MGEGILPARYNRNRLEADLGVTLAVPGESIADVLSRAAAAAGWVTVSLYGEGDVIVALNSVPANGTLLFLEDTYGTCICHFAASDPGVLPSGYVWADTSSGVLQTIVEAMQSAMAASEALAWAYIANPLNGTLTLPVGESEYAGAYATSASIGCTATGAAESTSDVRIDSSKHGTIFAVSGVARYSSALPEGVSVIYQDAAEALASSPVVLQSAGVPAVGYDSKADAVAAAENLYDSTADVQVVVVKQGVELEDVSPSRGVVVIHEEDLGVKQPCAKTVYPASRTDQVLLQRRTIRHGGGMIAIRNDDLSASLFTNFAAFGNKNFFQYAARHGVTISVALPSNGPAGNILTSAELQYKIYSVLNWGHHIMAHSVAHSTAPTTYAAQWEEIVGAKRDLESLPEVDLTAYANTYESGQQGITRVTSRPNVEAFIQPGTWDNPVNLYANSYPQANIPASQMIRRNYLCSEAYLTNHDDPRHHASAVKISSASTNATVDAIIERAKTPGNRITVYFHDIVLSGATGDSTLASVAAYLIEQVAAARDAGYFEAVTVPMLLLGEQSTHRIDDPATGVPVLYRRGGIPTGYFDHATIYDSDVLTSVGASIVANDGTQEILSGVAVPVNNLRPGPAGYMLKGDDGDDYGLLIRMYAIPNLRRGRNYLLNCDYLTDAVNSGVALIKNRQYWTQETSGADELHDTSRWNYIPTSANTWFRLNQVVHYPMDAKLWQVKIVNRTSGATGFCLKNLELYEI